VRTEYSSQVVGTDKHNFGYQINENKHFHHTTTEEDGVRLGCYGHEHEGKHYSTLYVADSKGYRIINSKNPIAVHPHSGVERKASFNDYFSEAEQKKQNIKFFFPDACEGKKKLISQVQPAELDTSASQNVIYTAANSKSQYQKQQQQHQQHGIKTGTGIVYDRTTLSPVTNKPYQYNQQQQDYLAAKSTSSPPRFDPNDIRSNSGGRATSELDSNRSQNISGSSQQQQRQQQSSTQTGFNPNAIHTNSGGSATSEGSRNLLNDNTCCDNRNNDDVSATSVTIKFPLPKTSENSCVQYATLIVPLERLDEENLNILYSRNGNHLKLVKDFIINL